MSRKVLVPVADGTEEMEAVIIIDILRRAGASVVVASVGEKVITASRATKITADCLIEDCADSLFDLVVIPGGMPGSEHLRDSAILTSILEKQHAGGRLYAAICAAPVVVLQSHGLLDGYMATCHPFFSKQIPEAYYSDKGVIADRNCVTSNGAGTAVEFALALVEMLFDNKTTQSIAQAICL